MNNSQASFLLVDGNNIIHVWPNLLKLHRQRNGLAHQELIQQLRSYHDSTDDRVVLVFDGRRREVSNEKNADGFQVIYSSSSLSADNVIERLALKYAHEYRIIVATNDIPVQDLVIAAGGEVISAEGLHDRVLQAQKQLTDWLELRRKKW